MIIGVWIYCIIGGIVFVWLNEHFYLENKETEEKMLMGESKKATVIGAIIAIDWILAIPILILPMIKEENKRR
jgi:hypothetical protein